MIKFIEPCADKSHNRWNTQDFYQTGIKDTRDLMSYLDSFELNALKSKCLDFGCGVGRMTMALADYYNEVHGVDISSPMIQHAKKNTSKMNCQFQLVPMDDLLMFADNYFDLIVSYLTLFHKEFMRILTLGGCAVFHIVNTITTGKLKAFMIKYAQLSKTLWRLLKRDARIYMFGIYCVPDDDVTRIIERNAGKVIDRLHSEETLGRDYTTIRYCIVKV